MLLSGDEKYKDKPQNTICHSYNNRIQVNDYAVDLDPGVMCGYTKNKWAHLMRSYFDATQFDTFLGRLNDLWSKKNNYFTAGYTFKVKVAPKVLSRVAKDKGSCLVGISVYYRPDKNLFHVKIHGRVGEVTRRFMMDLIMFNKMITEMVKQCPNEIPPRVKVEMYYSELHQNSIFAPMLNGVLVDLETFLELKEEPKHYQFRVWKKFQNYMDPDNTSDDKYATSRNIKHLLTGVRERKPLDLNCLVLPLLNKEKDNES